jgi:RNA polymerase sigma-70 factor (ECF subfamily)
MSQNDLEVQLEQHHTDAFGWALVCCGWDRHEAEDVLQASYLKILDRRAHFAGRSSFKTWLFGVVRYTAAEQRRRRTLRRLGPLGWLNGRPEAHDNGPDPAAEAERSDDAMRLTQALTRLPRRQRDVLHLVFYQGLSIRESADVLGVAVGTARTHYERGKKSLRTLLPPVGPE